MVRKKMEGDEQQRRQHAREAREAGESPSERGTTTGASKQRRHEQSDDHREKLESISHGKLRSVRGKKTEPRPGYGDREE